MPKIPKKKEKKPERSEGAIEATLAIRMNSTGITVDYECGNPDCQEQVSKSEDFDFPKDGGPIEIEASEGEAACEHCQTLNYNAGFAVSKL